jgi:NADPH-dependent 7-cyano-7-deazaguanine reductase QueF-like protein
MKENVHCGFVGRDTIWTHRGISALKIKYVPQNAGTHLHVDKASQMNIIRIPGD